MNNNTYKNKERFVTYKATHETINIVIDTYYRYLYFFIRTMV